MDLVVEEFEIARQILIVKALPEFDSILERGLKIN